MSTIAGDAIAMHLDAGRRAVAWWLLVCCALVAVMVAVGGITPGNCRPLVEAGADFVAASAGVWRFEQGPAAAVRAFTAAFAHP